MIPGSNKEDCKCFFNSDWCGPVAFAAYAIYGIWKKFCFPCVKEICAIMNDADMK